MKPEGPREWSPRMPQMEKFIHDQRIKMEWTPVPMNPNFEGEEWADGAFHYRVSLKKGPKSLVTYYSKGAGLPEPPEIAEVLGSVADDASGFENNPDLESWVREYGHEEDPDDEDPHKKDRKIFKAVEKIAEKLRKFLGDEPYKQLLYEVERE